MIESENNSRIVPPFYHVEDDHLVSVEFPEGYIYTVSEPRIVSNLTIDQHQREPNLRLPTARLLGRSKGRKKE